MDFEFKIIYSEFIYTDSQNCWLISKKFIMELNLVCMVFWPLASFPLFGLCFLFCFK